MRLAAAVNEGRVAGGADIGMQCLQRVDQHAGNVPAIAQHPQTGLVHLLQGVGFPGGERIADEVERIDYQVFDKRATVPLRRRLAVAGRAYVKTKR